MQYSWERLQLTRPCRPVAVRYRRTLAGRGGREECADRPDTAAPPKAANHGKTAIAHCAPRYAELGSALAATMVRQQRPSCGRGASHRLSVLLGLAGFGFRFGAVVGLGRGVAIGLDLLPEILEQLGCELRNGW